MLSWKVNNKLFLHDANFNLNTKLHNTPILDRSIFEIRIRYDFFLLFRKTKTKNRALHIGNLLTNVVIEYLIDSNGKFACFIY